MRIDQSAFSSFKTLWSNQNQQPTTIVETSAPVEIPALITIPDPPRSITSIQTSPPSLMSGQSTLAALPDSLGRVCVLDLREGEIIRVFKGIRDSQCGWISAWERVETDNDVQQRLSLVLAIYVPRGVLELYHMRHGKRLGAFQVGGGIRLIESCHGILGSAFAPVKTMPASRCFTLNSKGEIAEIKLPSLAGERFVN